MILRLSGGVVIALVAALVWAPSALAAPGNDAFSSAVTVQSGDQFFAPTYPASYQESTSGATMQAGEPVPVSGAGASVWFQFSPECTQSGCYGIQANTLNSDFDTVLALYCGTALNNLSLLTYNDDSEPQVNVTSQIFDDPNTDGCTSGEYWLQVTGYGGATGNLELSMLDVPNDNLTAGFDGWFTGSTDLGGGPTVATSDSTWGATRESGEPIIQVDGAPIDTATTNTVWYTWTPVNRGIATIDTTGSTDQDTFDPYDTVLGVFTGTTYGAQGYVAANDDNPSTGDVTSQVTFPITTGTAYRIQVGSYAENDWGTVALNIATTQANDTFVNAATITTGKGMALGGTTGATREAGEPNPLGGSPDGSVWYGWKAPTTGGISFDTIGSTADARLAVYTGASEGALTLVGADDNSAGGQAARVRFATVKNTMYWIQLDTVGGAGNTVLNWKTPTTDVQASQTGPSTGAVGAPITYTITVTNPGPQLAPSVTLDDTLPSNAWFLTVVPSAGSCTPPAAGHLHCSFGDIAKGAFRTVQVQVGAGSSRTITNSATVAFAGKDSVPGNNATGDLSTALSTPPKTKLASIADSGFTPPALTITPGWAVVWDVTGPGAHSAFDGNGAGLFNQAGGPPPDFGLFTFIAAGTYVVDDADSAFTETVHVKPIVSPASGNTATTFTVTWASGAPPAGRVFDVQIERPGQVTWTAYATGTTATGASFLPDAGAGTYKFRARYRRVSPSKASGWSPAASFTVS